MIEIIYYPRFNTVTVKGHAGFAENGKDIVCAAVSAIVWTLAEAVKRLDDENKILEPKIVIEKGKAEISADARADYEKEILSIFSFICGGFKHIAEQSPKYVSYIVRK